MQPAPKSMRLHIGLFGRRNAGKSSLLNAMTYQEVSIVSPVAGTTTDPVEKPMEMLPLGPVLWIDTAGIDDCGALGEKRVQKTRQVLDRTDLAILVLDAGRWEEFEEGIFLELHERKTPIIVAMNKSDVAQPPAVLIERFMELKVPFVETMANTGHGAAELREAILKTVPDAFLRPPPIIADLVPPGELAVLVTPIDLEAPKGRLILPQVQTLRDLLDGDAFAIVVKEHQLAEALGRLNRPPTLVVTDSQAFDKVADTTPPDLTLTSFSILMARQKGDLRQFVEGALAIERLRPGDRVLVAEACTHHPIGDDIGRVKIPNWLQQYVGGPLQFDTTPGRGFPANLADYKLVIHCGACMWNRREMLTRMEQCREAGVPISNYGMTIAYAIGIFERALEPFPEALEAYHRLRDALPPDKAK